LFSVEPAVMDGFVAIETVLWDQTLSFNLVEQLAGESLAKVDSQNEIADLLPKWGF
jgi:hypothetical protein